jgi:hypothetical protein
VQRLADFTNCALPIFSCARCSRTMSATHCPAGHACSRADTARTDRTDLGHASGRRRSNRDRPVATVHQKRPLARRRHPNLTFAVATAAISHQRGVVRRRDLPHIALSHPRARAGPRRDSSSHRSRRDARGRLPNNRHHDLGQRPNYKPPPPPQRSTHSSTTAHSSASSHARPRCRLRSNFAQPATCSLALPASTLRDELERSYWLDLVAAVHDHRYPPGVAH